MSAFGAFVSPGTVMVAAMLDFLGFLAKCINLYFLGAKVEPCRRAHVLHCLCSLSNVLTFSSVLVL